MDKAIEKAKDNALRATLHIVQRATSDSLSFGHKLDTDKVQDSFDCYTKDYNTPDEEKVYIRAYLNSLGF